METTGCQELNTKYTQISKTKPHYFCKTIICDVKYTVCGNYLVVNGPIHGKLLLQSHRFFFNSKCHRLDKVSCPPQDKSSRHSLASLVLVIMVTLASGFVPGHSQFRFLLIYKVFLQKLGQKTTQMQGLQLQPNYFRSFKPVRMVSQLTRRRGLLHTGLTCANQRNFLNVVVFCDLHKTSPKRSMFYFVSVTHSLARISGYAYILLLCENKTG